MRELNSYERHQLAVYGNILPGSDIEPDEPHDENNWGPEGPDDEEDEEEDDDWDLPERN